MSGRWAALSHCCGKPEHHPITTIKATLCDRLIAIPLGAIPKTFSDAVIITKNLGLCYLRIESLCIIQDGDDYWERESKKMGLIYTSGRILLSPHRIPLIQDSAVSTKKISRGSYSSDQASLLYANERWGGIAKLHA
jgi:hypothetical protein